MRQPGTIAAILACLALSGCATPPASLTVSTRSPPVDWSVNAKAQPEPANSLPPGAATSGTVPRQGVLSKTIVVPL